MIRNLSMALFCCYLFLVGSACTAEAGNSAELKVGWIGPMTGGAAKYAAWESAR